MGFSLTLKYLSDCFPRMFPSCLLPVLFAFIYFDDLLSFNLFYILFLASTLLLPLFLMFPCFYSLFKSYSCEALC